MKKLIVPLDLEQALAITVGMADTVMISSAVQRPVSGVSLIDMFNNLIISGWPGYRLRGGDFPVPRSREKRARLQLIVSSVCITIGISILVMAFCTHHFPVFPVRLKAVCIPQCCNLDHDLPHCSFPFLAL